MRTLTMKKPAAMSEELYLRITAVLVPLMQDFDKRWGETKGEEANTEWDAIVDRVVAELSVSLDDVIDVVDCYADALDRRAVLGWELGRLLRQHAGDYRRKVELMGQARAGPFRAFNRADLEAAMPHLQSLIPDLTIEEAEQDLDESWNEFQRSQLQ